MTARSLLLVAVLLVAAVAPVAGTGAATNHEAEECVGEINDPARGSTIVSVQGANFTDDGAVIETAYVAGFGPNGSIQWAKNYTAEGRVYVYDTEVLPNGSILTATTVPGETVVSIYNPETGETEWERQFPDVGDAHDVDLINGDQLLIGNKGKHRVSIYDIPKDEYVWHWEFDDHFPRSHGGPEGDWTHLNDVQKIDDGRYLVSPRNFNQVMIINRSGGIELTLGDDEDTSILHRQHNPKYYETDEGDPVFLVPDSLNDRVVEYTYDDGEWERTWVLEGGGLSEPRDAERLPNGNTLVVDRQGDRTLEVTPTGEVVWEVYTPWQPYGVERPAYGNEPDGPTSRDLGVTGTYELNTSAAPEGEVVDCAEALKAFEGETADVDEPNSTPNVTATPVDPDKVDDDGAETVGDDTPESMIDQPGMTALAALAALVAAVVLAVRRD